MDDTIVITTGNDYHVFEQVERDEVTVTDETVGSTRECHDRIGPCTLVCDPGQDTTRTEVATIGTDGTADTTLDVHMHNTDTVTGPGDIALVTIATDD